MRWLFRLDVFGGIKAFNAIRLARLFHLHLTRRGLCIIAAMSVHQLLHVISRTQQAPECVSMCLIDMFSLWVRRHEIEVGGSRLLENHLLF